MVLVRQPRSQGFLGFQNGCRRRPWHTADHVIARRLLKWLPRLRVSEKIWVRDHAAKKKKQNGGKGGNLEPVNVFKKGN